MNQNDNNLNNQNSNMPRVAPPVVAPPVVKPPVVVPPKVTPSTVKPPVVPTPNANSATITVSGRTNSTVVNPAVEPPINESKPVTVDVKQEPVVNNTIEANSLNNNNLNDRPSTISKVNETSNLANTNPKVTLDENRIESSFENTNPTGINDMLRGRNVLTKKEEPTSEPVEEEIDEETIIRKYKRKLRRRKIVKLVVLLLIFGGLGFAGFKIFEMVKPKPVEIVDQYISVVYDKKNYIAVKGKDGYGYINTKGKLVIKHQYKNAYDFYGDYALVEAKTDSPAPIYNIINRDGKVVKTTNFMPYYHADLGIWEIESKLYDDDLKPVSQEGAITTYLSSIYFYYSMPKEKKYGIINYEGYEILKIENEQSHIQLSTNEFNPKDIYAVLRDEKNMIKIVNIFDSEVVWSKSNDEVEIEHINNNVFKVFDKINSKYSWIYVKNSNVIYGTNEDLISLNVYDYKNEILIADSQYGKYYYDINEKTATNEVKEKSVTSSYGYDLVTKDNLMGLEKKGKTILETKYTSIKFLEKNLFEFIKDDRNREFVLATDYGKTYLIDVNKNDTIKTFNSINYILFDNTTFLRLDILDVNGNLKNYLIYNLMTGQTLEVDLDTEINYGANYISISDRKKIRYYNNEFKKIYEEQR